MLCHFFLSKPSEIGPATISILGKKMIKLREVKSFAQGHKVCKLLNRDSNQYYLGPKFKLLLITSSLQPALKRKKNTAFLPAWKFILIPVKGRTKENILVDLAIRQIR